MLDAVDHHHPFAEIDLGVAGRMDQRHEHLAVPDLVLAHHVFHDRVATGVTVFVAQALEDPTGRMPLLPMLLLVGLQGLLDESHERVELRPRRRY